MFIWNKGKSHNTSQKSKKLADTTDITKSRKLIQMLVGIWPYQLSVSVSRVVPLPPQMAHGGPRIGER